MMSMYFATLKACKGFGNTRGLASPYPLQTGLNCWTGAYYTVTPRISPAGRFFMPWAAGGPLVGLSQNRTRVHDAFGVQR